MKLEDTTEKIIKDHYKKTIFWLKPVGKDYCAGNKADVETKQCYVLYSHPFSGVDCKYLDRDVTLLNKGFCSYDKNNFWR